MKSVAVITRTKDRPLLLRRAAKSVAAQTFRDLIWVLVNDGGARDPVDSIADHARTSGVDVQVLHFETSRGMEAASNAGIRSSESEFVVIHDDDDTWEPTFLGKTVGYLASPGNARVGGVVTRATLVEERLDSDRVRNLRRRPYDGTLESVSLFKMATLERVPPNLSFLYRRSTLERVGLYREDLPVLGDWEFNLRFLRFYDVGVIRETLANYHWRKTGSAAAYGNTVVEAVSSHAEHRARLANELLRKDLEEGVFGLGVLVNLAQYLAGDDSATSRALSVARLFRTVRSSLSLPNWLRNRPS